MFQAERKTGHECRSSQLAPTWPRTRHRSHRRPTRARAAQQARDLADELDTRMEFLRFVLRDRDAKYDQSFDAVFQAEDMNVLLSAPRAPRVNAHCERVIGTVRREALDHVLLMNEGHARQVLAGFERHYNGHRPHRAREQRPPHASGQPATVHDVDDQRLLRTRILGGAINECR
jgi:transposase